MRVIRIAVGPYHTVALLADGSVACWGSNGDGQCDVPSGVKTHDGNVSKIEQG